MNYEQQQLIEKKLKILSELISADGPFTIGIEQIHGTNLRVFTKGPKNLRDFLLNRIKKHSDNIFLIYEDEKYTFNETLHIATALANSMKIKFGIKNGDRVSIAMRNIPEWCFSFIAVTLLGAVPIAINSLWTESEIEYGLKDSGSVLIICDHERLKRCILAIKKNPNIPAIVARTKIPLEIDDSILSRCIYFWNDMISLGSGNPIPQVEISGDDIGVLLYTSGSTGFPKGVVLTHKSISQQMISISLGYEIYLRTSDPQKNFRVTLLALPLFHATALHHVFLTSFVSGSKIVFMNRWDAGHALEIIENEKITHITCVPTMIQDMIEHPDFQKRNTSSLNLLASGGAPIPVSVVSKMHTKFLTPEKGQGYGLTETNGGITSNTGIIYGIKPKSVGVPGPLVELKIVDPNTGEEVPQGERGELLVKSILVMREYWNKPEETKKAIISIKGEYGWFRTGDIAEIDKEGFVYIVDRAKDIIIRGGENISCTEVESAFYQHPGVLECAAVPITHSRLGEVVGLVVVTKQDYLMNVEELIHSVKGKLSAFKIPEPQYIFFSTSPLPRGATAKINKLILKQRLSTLTAGSKL